MMKQQTRSFLLPALTFYKSNLWRGRLILAFVIIAILLGSIRLTLPYTITYSVTSWLKQQGITSSIEAINIDILDGSFSLINATGSENGSPLFNIGLVDINWHWAPLSEKTIVITKVVLDKFTVNIEKYTDKIIVGGVQIPLGSKTETSESTTDESDDVKPWAASLGQVVFTGLNICYLEHLASSKSSSDASRYVDYCVDLKEMSWGGTISYGTNAQLLKTDDLPLSSTGDFVLKGLTVTDNKIGRTLLSSRSNELRNVVISGLNDIHIDTLEMSGLSALHRDDKKHKDAVRFQQLAIEDINLHDLNALSLDNISISEPGLYLVKSDDQNWEHQQWVPNSQVSKPAPDDTGPAAADESSFKVSIDNINIENIDSCYLERSTALYYCLVVDNLRWDGNIKYDTSASNSDNINLSAAGDLMLSHPNIQNKTIERNLVDFKSLSLTNINLTDPDTVSLDSLKLDTFSALQRSQQDNDNTVSFDSLAIDNINYSNNNISINSIDLNGLASTLSKNKKGEWEHNKWALDHKEKPGAETKTPTQKPDPFVIALNKFNIASDNKILLTDNSTQPATEMGLHKLAVDIKNLNSTKPDSNSPFKLYAKTLRHSTIDIKGTIKPFAEKLSFDADGKLKGLDLRAASPAVKKAIGHVIKSGQMDTDLDLVAVDGVLDSKVSISLYHFKIKPESKEDADRLDKQFGMPLNQTLVLLRDKDDSIHLDIPITGDVNNPDFDPMDAIIKATSKAATVTLITFYTPYGLIYAGGNIAFNLATALNFDPIEFDSGSPDMRTESKEQLDGLAKLLIEKPHVHLTLCGVTNQQDTFTFYPELKPEKTKDKDTKEMPPLNKEQLLKLEKLASDRQENSKNYLINKHGIKHDRLILCEPEHKTGDDDISGVEVNI